jgi:hypothetical protein
MGYQYDANKESCECFVIPGANNILYMIHAKIYK